MTTQDDPKIPRFPAAVWLAMHQYTEPPFQAYPDGGIRVPTKGWTWVRYALSSERTDLHVEAVEKDMK